MYIIVIESSLMVFMIRCDFLHPKDDLCLPDWAVSETTRPEVRRYKSEQSKKKTQQLWEVYG